MSIKQYFKANQLAKAGYVFNTGLGWWFNSDLKVAVHNTIIRDRYSDFINNKNIGYSLYGWVFYSPTKRANRDILDTVFLKYCEVRSSI